MHLSSRRHSLFGLVPMTLALGCGGPPSAPVASTLSPPTASSPEGAHGAFGVAFAGPRDEVSNLREPAITVLFNRPMRDIEAPDQVGLPAMKLEATGDVRVAGAWRWVGTHGLLFTPEQPLPGSTRFHVVVPAGTRAATGEALTADYAFDFSTPRPAIVASDPRDGARDVRTDAAFRVRWNQPMPLDVVEHAAHLRVEETPGTFRDVAVKARPATGGVAPERSLVLVPAESLPRDRAVELVIDAGVHGAGPLTAKTSQTLRFRTFGPLALASILCPRAKGPRCQAHRDFTVVLSNAVDPADFRAHLRVPGLRLIPPPKTPTLGRRGPPPMKDLLVAADPDFGARYHVTVTKGLRDVFGQHLEHDLTFDVDIEDPWTPPPDGKDGNKKPSDAAETAANETAPGVLGPPSSPTVPHRLRLDYGVQLGVTGHVVEALAKEGEKAHLVPIGDVNVPTYGLASEKLDEDDVFAWLARRPFASGEGPGRRPWRWSWVTPGVPTNVRDVRSVDLDRLLGGDHPRGAAIVAALLPGDTFHDTGVLTVTDLAVSAEVSRFGSLVWVTHLSNGAPVAGASVSLRGVPAASAITVTTDSAGLATIPAGDWLDKKSGRAERVDPYFVVRSGDDWTFTHVERARASYALGVDVDSDGSSDWAGMTYTDRGVYRPGEVMKVAGVFRKVDAAGVSIVKGQDARVLVEDAQGEKVFDGRSKLGAFGELSLEVPLSKTSHLGSATIKVMLGRSERDSFSSDVLLAAYKASEFQVGAAPDRPAYVRGDTATFALDAEYLFGAPMAGAHYRTSVTRRRAPFTPAKSDGFVTSDDLHVSELAETNAAARSLKDGEGTLDDAGHASASVPLDLPDLHGAEEVTLEVEVSDLSHETVAHRATARLDPAAFYVGLGQPPSRFVSVGATVPVHVAAFEPNGAHVPGVPARVDLLERTWTTAVLDEAADVPGRASHVHDEVVGSCAVTTSATVASCEVRVPKPGYFILRVQAKDSRGNLSAASSSFYALSDRSDAVVSWAPPSGPRKLTLESDKKLYEAGETAHILVENPFKAAEALVTVERGGVMDRRVVSLEGPMPTVDIPVKADYFPNAFVSVRLVRGRVSEAPLTGADVGAPDFRLGVLPISVDSRSHRLTASISTDKKEYRPGDEVLADVQVTGMDGKPARGEVTFYAADEGVLLLTGYATPDPLPAFSAARTLAVYSVESREDLAHVLALKNGERVSPLGYDYLHPAGGNKGGDGGGGSGKDGARADFKTTAYFEGGRVTDDEGRVRYRFKLPDNLTTFRLMAVVAGADDRFGAGDTTIVSSKPLMARPVLPRIVRVGDHFEAGVLISSKDLPATSAVVSVNASGVTLDGPASRTVTVPRGGSVEVRFPFVADVPGAANFDFVANASRSRDSVHVERHVDLPLSVETSSSYGATTTPTAIQLGDLSHLRPDQGGLTVHLASTALVGLGTSFDRLVDYPYGCTEQLASRILPLLVLPDLAKAVGARLPAHVPDAIDDGLGALLTHQRGDGGFGFWGNDGESSEPWLSAYAMLAIGRAADQGLFVPHDAIDSGMGYLRRVLADSAPADVGEGADANAAEGDAKTKEARDYADLAFVADVLASLGQPDVPGLDRLFEARTERPLFTQALLLHAMAVAHRAVSELDVLLSEITPRIRQTGDDAFADESPTGYDEYLDSSTRTSALLLRAILAAHPDSPLGPKLARGLLSRRRGGAWRSTQENSWALLALDAYRKAEEAAPPDFDARAFLGGRELGEAHFHGPSSEEQTLTADMARVFPLSEGKITLDVVGKGKLFYAAELRTASAILPATPRDAGLFVQKIVRAVRPAELAKAEEVLPQHGDTRAAPGDIVLVDVLLESAEPREQVLVDDPLPAGLEPIDMALATAAQSVEVTDEHRKPGDRHTAQFDYGVAFGTPRGVHREQHDDRVLTFLSHIDPGIYHFRYVARATTPGDFVVPPTQASCMYAPEVSGASAASRFVVGSPPVTVAKSP